MVMENVLEIQAFYWENPNDIWCISCRDAYLYKVNLEKACLEEILLASNGMNVPNMFGNILKYNDHLILIPQYSDDLVLVDPRSRTYESISVPPAGRRIGSSGAKFFGGIVYEDCLYLFGYAYPGILKINLLNRNITILDEWLKDTNLVITDETDGFFHVNYCLLDDIIYLPFMNANAILKFDLKTEKAVVLKAGDSSQRYVSIEWDGENFWLAPRDGSKGSIVKWNPESDAVKYFNKYPEGFNYEKYAFFKTVNVGDKIFLFASAANMNISVDISTGEMELLPDICDTSDIKKAKYRFAELVSGKILFQSRNEYIFWDYTAGEVERLAYSVDEKIFERFEMEQENRRIKKYFDGMKSGIVLKEKESINIKSLMMYLQMPEKGPARE